MVIEPKFFLSPPAPDAEIPKAFRNPISSKFKILATDAAEAATKLAAELAAESAGNVTTNNGAPKFGIGGQPLGDNGYSAGYGMGFNSTASTGTIDNSLTINIEGMIDSGSFDEVVNQSLLNNIRRGYSQFPAGAIATP